jgi:hypothetical protein
MEPSKTRRSYWKTTLQTLLGLLCNAVKWLREESNCKRIGSKSEFEADRQQDLPGGLVEHRCREYRNPKDLNNGWLLKRST